MNIVTVHFDHGDGEFDQLLSALRKSVELYAPWANFHVIHVPVVERDINRPYGLTFNTDKLRHWVEFQETSTGDTIFIDCDMLMNNSPAAAFNEDFDVAYTARCSSAFLPLNGGVMFARPTEEARSFFREMLRVNNAMYADKEFHKKWKDKYAGMNQSALGYMLKESEHPAKVHEYRTCIWNAVEEDWLNCGPETVFIHFKTSLRKAVMNRKRPAGRFKYAMQKWYSFVDVQETTKKAPVNHRRRRKRRIIRA